MIEAITATIDALRNRPTEDGEQEGEEKSAIDQTSTMNMFMQSKAARYMDLIMQRGGLLPLNSDRIFGRFAEMEYGLQAS